MWTTNTKNSIYLFFFFPFLLGLPLRREWGGWNQSGTNYPKYGKYLRITKANLVTFLVIFFVAFYFTIFLCYYLFINFEISFVYLFNDTADKNTIWSLAAIWTPSISRSTEIRNSKVILQIHFCSDLFCYDNLQTQFDQTQLLQLVLHHN